METQLFQIRGGPGRRGPVWLFCLALLVTGAMAGEQDERAWSVFGYGARWTDSRLGNIARLRTDFRNSYVWAAGVSRPVHAFTDHLSVILEINAAVHSGLQRHSELNAALLLRWDCFPWDSYLDTSFSYGLGPSYAFRKPEVEQRRRREAAHLLVFMPMEFTFAPPRRLDPSWEALIRIHHRSGAYGVVSNAPGSNFIAAGIRYRI